MSCNYDVSALKNFVYFFSDGSYSNSKMHLDGSNKISYVPSCTKYKVNSVSITSTSELNRRYAFVHQLTFTIDGIDDNLTTLVRSYKHVGFQNENGVIFMLNPELNYECTYTITYENKTLQTSYTLQIKDNQPFMAITNVNVVNEVISTCGYSSHSVKNVYVNNYDYARISDSGITYIEDNDFAKLGCLEDSISFTSTTNYNGQTTDTFNYQIPTSDEEDMLHYDTLENNKYVIVIQFSNDKCIPIGFNNGLYSNYDVSQSNSESTINMQLIEVYDTGRHITLMDDDFVQLSEFEYEYTTYGSICSENNGYAQYILKQKQDKFGNKYDDYLAYTGHENDFPELNVTGTFDTTETFESKECYVEPPYVKINTPTILFNKRYERKNFVVESNTDWKLRTSTGIIITPNSGSTGTTNITIQNNYTVPQLSIFTIRCDHDGDTEIIGSISVIKKQLDDVFPFENVVDCNYKAQIAKIYIAYPATSLENDGNLNCWYENNYIYVELFENTTSNTVYTISATTEYGVYEAYINQSMLYVVWRYSGRNGCDGNDLREIEVKYISEDDELYTPTQEERFGAVVQSGYCADKQVRIVDSNRSYCNGSSSFKIMETQESTDNFTTYSVTNETLGDYIGSCSANLTYSWSLSTKIGKWNNRDCYLYIKTYFNVDTHASGAVVPFTFSPDGDGSQQVHYVDEP